MVVSRPRQEWGAASNCWTCMRPPPICSGPTPPLQLGLGPQVALSVDLGGVGLFTVLQMSKLRLRQVKWLHTDLG